MAERDLPKRGSFRVPSRGTTPQLTRRIPFAGLDTNLNQ